MADHKSSYFHFVPLYPTWIDCGASSVHCNTPPRNQKSSDGNGAGVDMFGWWTETAFFNKYQHVSPFENYHIGGGGSEWGIDNEADGIGDGTNSGYNES